MLIRSYFPESWLWEELSIHDRQNHLLKIGFNFAMHAHSKTQLIMSIVFGGILFCTIKCSVTQHSVLYNQAVWPTLIAGILGLQIWIILSSIVHHKPLLTWELALKHLTCQMCRQPGRQLHIVQGTCSNSPVRSRSLFQKMKTAYLETNTWCTKNKRDGTRVHGQQWDERPEGTLAYLRELDQTTCDGRAVLCNSISVQKGEAK